MLALISDTLKLLEEEENILATPEDALYFRLSTKKKQKIDPVVCLPKPALPQEPLPIPVSIPISAPILEQKVALPVVEEPIHREMLNTTALKLLMQKTFPQIPFISTIPSDLIAKKIANRWKTKNKAAPISILFSSESAAQKELIENIAQAIDIYFGQARLIHADPIEKEKQWETFLSSSELKLVIACDYTLWQLKDLMQYFKDGQIRTLKNIPLFLLPDLSLYLKDPQLKRSLWKGICQKILS